MSWLMILFPLAPLLALTSSFLDQFNLISETNQYYWINYFSGLPLVMWFVDPLHFFAPLVDFAVTGAGGYMMVHGIKPFSVGLWTDLWDQLPVMTTLLATSFVYDFAVMIT